MSLVNIDGCTTKEDKLERILDYLGDLKDALVEVVDMFEAEEAPEQTVDMLTGALDAVEDAYDVIMDAIEDMD